jgi:hypothetical protein
MVAIRRLLVGEFLPYWTLALEKPHQFDCCL